MIDGNFIKQPSVVGSSAGLISIALGLFVILGWLIDSRTLVQILPSFAPMQFNTALCFLLSGLALALLSRERTEVSCWLGSSVLLIALVTLSQYAFGLDVGLDNLFINHHITTNTSHAGRMAPNTALCFTLFGLAVAIESIRLSRKRLLRSLYLTEILSPLIVGLATMSLFGYVFKNEMAVAWANLTGMALHTTIGLIFLGFGLSYVIWSRHKNQQLRRAFWFSSLLLFCSLALDISQPVGVAAGVAYVPLVFCSYWFRGQHVAFSFGAIATVLTIVGYFTSAHGEVAAEYAVYNRVLAILAIWITAFAVFYRKRSEMQLLASRQALETSIKEVEQFTYIASHDLRAPLRAIGNLAQWIEDDLQDVLTEETRENMDLLRSRVKRLDKLLDDILNFTRAGRRETKSIPVDIGEMLASIRELTYLNDKFTLEIEGKLPEVIAPEGSMELIFANLINNAIHHHHRDSGKVSVVATESEIEWTFKIIDDGPGVPEEYRESVFEMFKKLEGRDRNEGSGMGLSIVRKLVSLRNGRVWVEGNQNGQGSCFQFSWPKSVQAAL